jgi:hypothetical protein
MYAEKSSAKFQFNLAWEGTHYPMGRDAADNPHKAKVIRWMCHLDINGNEDWFEVPGQYERTFIGQSSGTVTWEIEESMEEFYWEDRQAAKERKSGSGHYQHAIVATDKQLQNYSHPIKSGYYFNPGGTYKCTIYTEQYKDTDEPTREHKELAEAIKKAFIYESNLVYADSQGNQVKLGPITLGGKTRNLLETTKEEYSNETGPENLLPTGTEWEELEESGATHPLIKETLEGYEESGTAESWEIYRYREQTYQEIWLVKERTELEFTLAAPGTQKLYTHVQMKNGEYGIRAMSEEIKFEFENNEELTIPSVILDGIKVTVMGSMYDDR